MTTTDPFPCCQFFQHFRKKIVDMQVRKHLETNNIFFDKQHGFGQKHSTETTLGKLVGNFIEIFDKKHKAIAVFIDLAFDSVQHNILLS